MQIEKSTKTKPNMIDDYNEKITQIQTSKYRIQISIFAEDPGQTYDGARCSYLQCCLQDLHPVLRVWTEQSLRGDPVPQATSESTLRGNLWSWYFTRHSGSRRFRWNLRHRNWELNQDTRVFPREPFGEEYKARVSMGRVEVGPQEQCSQ